MKTPRYPAAKLRQLFFKASLTILAAATVMLPKAWAQSQPLTIVVGVSAAGPLDLQARALAAAIQSVSGRPVAVQNQVGGAGTVAAEMVANARGNTAILLLHSNYFQSSLAASLQPVALISETALGLWRNPATANTQANVAHSSSPAAYSFIYANLTALAQISGSTVTAIPYKGAGPALVDARRSGDYFLADLSNMNVAREQGMQLVTTSSPNVAERLGLAPVVRAVPGLRELVIPVGLYAPPGTAVAADVLADIDKAIASPGFRAHLKSNQYRPPAQSSANALVEQLNVSVGLAEVSVAAGAFLPPPYRLAQVASYSGQPSRQSSALRDDPKTVGLRMRGG